MPGSREQTGNLHDAPPAAMMKKLSDRGPSDVGTLRREYLDQLFFWNGTDLERKLLAYRDYYNQHRCHTGLRGETPNGRDGESDFIRND
jgi:Integrase core domain